MYVLSSLGIIMKIVSSKNNAVYIIIITVCRIVKISHENFCVINVYACIHASLQKRVGYVNLTWVVLVAIASSYMRVNMLTRNQSL